MTNREKRWLAQTDGAAWDKDWEPSLPSRHAQEVLLLEVWCSHTPAVQLQLASDGGAAPSEVS